MRAAATLHFHRCSGVFTLKTSSPTGRAVLPVSASLPSRGGRHGKSKATPQSVSPRQTSTAPLSAVFSPDETVADVDASAARPMTPKKTPMQTTSGELFFDHLREHGYDVHGVLQRHAQRQQFPRTTPRVKAGRREKTTAVAAHSASSGASIASPLADEFPPPPPGVVYEEVAPYIELVRVESPAGSERRSDRREKRLALPVLVGWFGCRRSHLRKYAAMYTSPDIGYDAVLCIRPPAAATLFPALGDAFAASALTAVETVQRRLAREAGTDDEENPTADDRPVLLHLFSNGGYLFAGNVLHAHCGAASDRPRGTVSVAGPSPKAARRFTRSVAALVVDSAPGALEPDMVAASFRAVLQGSAAPATDRSDAEDGRPSAMMGALRRVAAALLVWGPVAHRMRCIDAAWGGHPAVSGASWSGDGDVGPAAEVAFAAVANARGAMRFANEDGARTAAKIRRRVRDEQTPGATGLLWCPAMFMYSAADPLIPPSHVEAFASARAMRIGKIASAKTDGAGIGGGMVVMKRWETAPHCEIGRVDPDGYRSALRAFLCPTEGSGGEDATEKGELEVKPWDRD